jgi:hypothetical protein
VEILCASPLQGSDPLTIGLPRYLAPILKEVPTYYSATLAVHDP